MIITADNSPFLSLSCECWDSQMYISRNEIKNKLRSKEEKDEER